MGEGEVITLLVSCGIAAAIGSRGEGHSYTGAHVVAGFILVGAIAGWVQQLSFSWLQIVAPVVFGYGAAGLAATDRQDRERRGRKD